MFSAYYIPVLFVLAGLQGAAADRSFTEAMHRSAAAPKCTTCPSDYPCVRDDGHGCASSDCDLKTCCTGSCCNGYTGCFYVPCPAPTPPPTPPPTYDCEVNITPNKCVEKHDGKGGFPTLGACQANPMCLKPSPCACIANQTFTGCVKQPAGQGPFPNLTACNLKCSPSPVQTFKCIKGQCTPATGGLNKNACEQICG
jgi:hypothetical protein